jgi:hypothetical protein
MKNKTTAVSFLAIELINKSENDFSNTQAQKIITIDLDLFYELVEKSLELEKEQLFEAFVCDTYGTKIGFQKYLNLKFENQEMEPKGNYYKIEEKLFFKGYDR